VSRALSISTTTHGRVIVDDAAPDPEGVLVVFHGYGQGADIALEDARKIPGAARWWIVAVQALHVFYARDNTTVIGSWMTRQDRELAIADNVAYVDRALDEVFRSTKHPAPGTKHPAPGTKHPAPGTKHPAPGTRHLAPGTFRIVFVGFSQGVAMAYRAALLGSHPAAGIVALAGDIPPELKTPSSAKRPWPPVLIGVGQGEIWYGNAKVENDLAFLRANGLTHELVRFRGGHEWTDEFRQAIGKWISSLAGSSFDP
jgi:phospholipase/carboxylesterase